jgi:lysophospholipase L1-like esterase
MRTNRSTGTWKELGALIGFAAILCITFVAGFAFAVFQNTNGARKEMLFADYGELGQYRAANLALPPDPNRVIFLGDSITYLWNLEASFPGENNLNRGINGQTTSQMLVRFRQDVLDLQPATVVILAGTNDLGETSAAPTPIPDIERNLQTMAELTVAHHIRPVFASLLPVNNYTSKAPISGLRSPQSLVAINDWLKAYCGRNGYTYLDYHSAMVSANGLMRRDLSDDGLHPNAAGYQIMASITKSALKQKPQ